MKKAKQILSCLLAALLLAGTAVCFAPLTSLAAGAELAGDDFYVKLMYPDIQAFPGSKYLAWSGSTNLSGYPNLYNVYLARNEKEGYQIYFYEENEAGRALRLEVDPYVNEAGDTLEASLFSERFFTVANVIGTPRAEALVPYAGETISVEYQGCAVFYVELRAAKDQPAGVYTSHFRLLNAENEVVQEADVSATVWNFALPEAHYGTMVAGLYNSISGYGGTQGFLAKSGIRFSGYEPVEEDKAEAERILEGWQEFLLDHGVTTYEIPRWLIDTDEKAAALTMADPRRKVVGMPLLRSGYSLTAAGKAKIGQYKDLIYDTDYLRNKIFFYPADEINWANDADAANVVNFTNSIKALWPDYHAVIPINSAANYEYMSAKLKEIADIYCPNQCLLNGNQTVYDDFVSGDWNRTWRYLCQDHTGCVAVIRWGKTPMGTYVRAPFWQAEVMGSEGLLNWNIAYVPKINGEYFDIWKTKEIYPRAGSANVNGEGIFAYESASLGFDPATPIASLRLKHISNAQDDYDYLELAKEAFGTGADSVYTQALNKVFRYYSSKGPKYIFSSETSAWPDGANYEWIGHDDTAFVQARVMLGEALSEAWNNESFDHTYSDWQTVVTPDETHNGLAVRTCTKCGAEESKKMYLCDDGSHNDSLYTPIDADTHEVACAICGRTRTEAHTPIATDGKAPTCTEDGYTAGTVCAKCGAVLEDTEILPAAHTLNAVEARPYSCTEAGNIAYWTCSVCGKVFADAGADMEITLAETVLPAAHSFGEWIFETPPTCVAAGEKGHYTCSVCWKNFDANKNEILDLTLAKTNEHLWDGGRETLQPTCKTEGKRLYTCLNGCGATREEPIAKLTQHAWNGGAVTKNPTCTEDGSKTFTCTVCGETKNETLPKLGHTAANGRGQCDRCGAQLVSACKYCGEVHSGFPGQLIGFFHNILWFFKNLFR